MYGEISLESRSADGDLYGYTVAMQIIWYNTKLV